MPDSLYQSTINRRRRTGVLLHPTSLPGLMDNGDIGHEAYRFIEFLHSSGFKVWQMLPLGPTHDDKSPYQCLSSHAGNPALISLNWLEDRGWLDTNLIGSDENENSYRSECISQAAEKFYQLNNKEWMPRLKKFVQKHSSWLEDYSLFIALKHKHDDRPWYDWPEEFRHRNRSALDDARFELQDSIKQTFFEQFIFFTQWAEVREYARQHQIELFGDMPIFVARDSADVWAERSNFLMNEDGEMEYVAGVPPDAFSETGQRWGNPLFDWNHMLSDRFSWWKARFKTQLELFDMLRIDHFRGLQACWQIPGHDNTAINGEWVEVPGRELLKELFEAFDQLPLVAEDLGVITEPVILLKNEFNLPGMKVLQFAFDGNCKNPHLPHNHEPGDVVYTGTHDNDTSLGWVMHESNYNKQYLFDYTNNSKMSFEKRVIALIRMALSSVSFLSVIPMQDILMLDSTARMNMPGTMSGNWQWRFSWEQVNNEMMDEISNLMTIYER